MNYCDMPHSSIRFEHNVTLSNADIKPLCTYYRDNNNQIPKVHEYSENNHKLQTKQNQSQKRVLLTMSGFVYCFDSTSVGIVRRDRHQSCGARISLKNASKRFIDLQW